MFYAKYVKNQFSEADSGASSSRPSVGTVSQASYSLSSSLLISNIPLFREREKGGMALQCPGDQIQVKANEECVCLIF